MLAVHVERPLNTSITEQNMNDYTRVRNHLNVNGVANALLTLAHTASIGIKHGVKMQKAETERRKNQEVKVWMLKRKDLQLEQKLLQVMFLQILVKGR